MALLSAFNPHEFSESTVRTVSTGRDDDLGDVLATIRSNLAATTLQHLIVSAPRGYGKSFMMRHVQIEAERIAREQSLPLAIVLMPEEMPHVKEPETLIRELTRALTGGAGADAELTWHEDEGAGWEAAVAELEAAVLARVGAQGLFVALVENFDVLLRRAFSKEVQLSRLRALLTAANGRMMLIAASASGAFDRDYDSRLFQAFREIVLQPWSVQECLDFFDRQRRDAGKAPLDDAARARAKAVASFIGGTPRLATLLGDALFDEDVLHAADLLQRLIDELTPYYKDRIDALPGRSQKLLDALLRGGEPATQSEIARRVKANSQAAIAGPFNDLVKERIVLGEKAPDSAEVLYRVSDRVFAHYYRRRVVEHGRAACPLEALVDLLADYFSPQEKRAKAAEFARRGRIAEARLMARLADGGRRRASRQEVLYDLARHYIPKRLLPLASDALASDLRAVAEHAARGEVDQAYERLERADGGGPTDRVLCLLVRSSLDASEGIEEGLAAAEAAVALARQAGDEWLEILAGLQLVWSLSEPGRHAEALALSLHLAERSGGRGLDGAQANALRHAAYNLSQLGRYEEAVTTARQAASLANAAGDLGVEAAVATRHAAYSLGALGRHEEAITTARQAASLANAAGDLSVEAVATRHAAYSLGELGRHEEALTTARQAARLANAAGDLPEEAISTRAAAYNLAMLGRHEEAITTARQAASLANAAGHVVEEGASRRVLAMSLGGSGDREAALEELAQAADLLTDVLEEWVAPSLTDVANFIGRGLSTSPSPSPSATKTDDLHGVLRVAADRLSGVGLHRVVLDAWLGGLSEGAMTWVEDPAVLEAWATAIVLHLPGRFGVEASRLRDAARYHEAGRDPAVLARLDPDLGRTLRIMFPSPAESSGDGKPKKRRKR